MSQSLWYRSPDAPYQLQAVLLEHASRLATQHACLLRSPAEFVLLIISSALATYLRPTEIASPCIIEVIASFRFIISVGAGFSDAKPLDRICWMSCRLNGTSRF
jgi:hypothetical protein